MPLSLNANVPSAMVICWKGMPMAVVAIAGAVVGSYLGCLFSMVSENGIGYFAIMRNLFMELKFFMPTKPKKENLAAAEERKSQHKTVIALTGAVSHVAMGAAVELILPSVCC